MTHRTLAALHARPPRLDLVVAGVVAAAVGCGGQVPNAPDVGLVTISGHVYHRERPRRASQDWPAY